jgi:ABC-type transport system substrate-binding protein
MDRSNYWTRRTFTRRRTLAGAGIATSGLAGLALVGCGDDDDDSTPAPTSTGTSASTSTGTSAATTTSTATVAATETPKRGDELVVGQGASGAQSMDPHISLNKAFTYWNLLTDKMVSPHPLSVQPLEAILLEEWEQPDATSLVLKVRQGVKWHEGKATNGRALTAEDIAFNIMRIAAKFDESRSALFQRRTLLNGLDKAEATDESTVKVTLSAANAAFMIGLSDARQFTVAKENVDADPDFQRPADFSGTGAWVIDSYDDATSTGTYTANPNYWRKGQPYFNKLRQVLLADGAAASSAFVSKQLPIVQGSQVVNPIVERGRGDAKYFTSEYVGWDYLRINQTRGQFTDPRVRKALHLILNRQELGDAGYGEGNWDYTGTLPSGLPGAWNADQVAQQPGYNPTTKDKDIADALKLLEAAGFPNGKGVSFGIIPLWIPGNKLTDDPVRAKDQWEKVLSDISIEITPPADGADHARKLGTGDYDMICYVSFPAPDAALEGNQHYGLTGGRNYTKYDNPKAEALIQKTFQELDLDERNDVIDEFQKLLLDDIFILTTNKNRPQWWLDPSVRGFDETNVGPGGFGGYDITYYARQTWYA